MLIDFHTHAFPDKIAAKTIDFLEKSMEERIRVAACTDGTVAGLESKLIHDGVDLGVVMPIATKISQIEHINDFAEKLRTEHLISFGGIHPFAENCGDILESLAERGFRGVKLHPEYQGFDIDCRESVSLLRKAESLGLYVTVHAGFDPAYPPPYHCTPLQMRNVLQCVSGKYIICAHMGGREMFDDVEKYLVGTPVLLDTAAVIGALPEEQYRRIILEHGADKILFASDCPWEEPKRTLAALKALKLPKADFTQICYLNACGILGIDPSEGR